MPIPKITIKMDHIRHTVQSLHTNVQKFKDELFDELEKEGINTLKSESPKNTGRLSEGFESYRKDNMLGFYNDVETEDGLKLDQVIGGYGRTKSSPGRYVPAIGEHGARLVKGRNISDRRKVYKTMREEGYSEKDAKRALTTPITTELIPRTGTSGIFTPRLTESPEKISKKIHEDLIREGYKLGSNELGVEWNRRYRRAVNKIINESQKKRTGGIITLDAEIQRPATKRHELVHAVQWAAGRPWGADKSPEGVYDRKMLEAEARNIAERSWFQSSNIGTHPGSKKTPFYQNTYRYLHSLARMIIGRKIKIGS